jgi:FkbM family methyltransferase
MALLARITPRGGTVLDLGAHIGFLSLYFASLVGPEGRVFAFEPGPNNLAYLRRNARARSNLTVVPCGAGDENGQRVFYTETLTGQNNSFIRDFDILDKYRKMAFDSMIRVKEERVEVVTLDSFVRREALRPDLIKIDVEGFEENVLRGAQEVLSILRPILLVEIQTRKREVLDLLRASGYVLFSPRLARVSVPEDLDVNTFCFHGESHAELVRRLTG